MELPSCDMEISNTNLMSIYDSEGIISEGSNLILRNAIYVSFSVYFFSHSIACLIFLHWCKTCKQFTVRHARFWQINLKTLTSLFHRMLTPWYSLHRHVKMTRVFECVSVVSYHIHTKYISELNSVYIQWLQKLNIYQVWAFFGQGIYDFRLILYLI